MSGTSCLLHSKGLGMRLRGGSSVDVPSDGSRGWVSAGLSTWITLMQNKRSLARIARLCCIPCSFVTHLQIEKQKRMGADLLPLKRSHQGHTGRENHTLPHLTAHPSFFCTLLACIYRPDVFQGFSPQPVKCQHGLHQDHVEKGTKPTEESRGAHLCSMKHETYRVARRLPFP
jgi:hypothetical protein